MSPPPLLGPGAAGLLPSLLPWGRKWPTSPGDEMLFHATFPSQNSAVASLGGVWEVGDELV